MELLLTFLGLFGWLLLVLLALLVLIFALPFHLLARGAVDSEQEQARLPLGAMAEARGSWAWGFLSLSWGTERGGEVRILGLRVARFSRDDSSEKKREKKDKKEKKTKDKRYSARWAMQHRRTLLGLLGRLLGALRLRLAIAGALGLGDPADTVILAELLRMAHAELPGATLDIDVDYLDEVLVLDGVVSGRIWLLHLAGIALWELRRREVRQMLGDQKKLAEPAAQRS